MPEQGKVKIIAENRQARHEYFVVEGLETGIELVGTEVKSLRMGQVNLKDAWVEVENGQLYVHGMHISPYEQGSFSNSDPLRPKKLLLHKSEIRKLSGLVSRQGYTLIPLKVYLKDGRMKLELGLCRGKHLHDKRDAAAARDAKREMERALRQHE